MSTIKYKALDTNIILDNAHHIETLGSDSIILLTDTVLDELDKKKVGFGETAYQAREFGRLITEAKVINSYHEVSKDMYIVELLLDSGVHITTVSYTAHQENTTNDIKILTAVREFYMLKPNIELTFITNDVLCKIRAISMGIDAKSLRSVENSVYEFIKTVTVPDDAFRDMHRKPVQHIDPSYDKGTYSYRIVNSSTGQLKLATVHNGTLHVLGKETEQELRKQLAPPLNSDHLFCAKAIQDPSIDIVVIEGPAGSGKNITAFSNAFRLMDLNKDKYHNLYYIRVPINDEDKGEDVGYLATNEAKLELYMGPIHSNLKFLAGQSIDTKKYRGKERLAKIEVNVDKIIEKYGIEYMTSTGTRGITFENSVIILDEMSNASNATMQKLLTRVGKNCKIVVLGSLNQIDNPYTNKYSNGLTALLDEASKRSIKTDVTIFAVQLSRIVRSAMTEFAEAVFKKYQ